MYLTSVGNLQIRSRMSTIRLRLLIIIWQDTSRSTHFVAAWKSQKLSQPIWSKIKRWQSGYRIMSNLRWRSYIPLFCSMMEEHQNNLRKIISLLGVMKSTRSFKRMLRFLVGTCGLYEIRLEQGQKMRSSLFRLRPCKLYLKMGMQPLAKLVHTAMFVNFSRKVHKEKEAQTS